MFCNKCHKEVPDDSVFCQYCGQLIKNEEVLQMNEAGREIEHSMTYMDIMAQEISEVIASRDNEDNKPHDNYGLTATNPIYTCLIEGTEEYLASLYTIDNQKLSWKRLGSTAAKGVNGMVDIYEGKLYSDKVYGTIYINMYAGKNDESVPEGYKKVTNVGTVGSTESSGDEYDALNDHSIKKFSPKFISAFKIVFVILAFIAIPLTCLLMSTCGEKSVSSIDQERWFHQGCSEDDRVYSSVISFEPVYLLGKVGAYQAVWCKCKTQAGNVNWVYISIRDYKQYVDSSVSAKSSKEAFKEVTFSTVQTIHGVAKRADSLQTNPYENIDTIVLLFQSMD